MKIFMFFIMFLLIGAFTIISNENIHLNSKENVYYFFKLYGQWFDKLSANSKVVSGYIIKMEWMPDTSKNIP